MDDGKCRNAEPTIVGCLFMLFAYVAWAFTLDEDAPRSLLGFVYVYSAPTVLLCLLLVEVRATIRGIPLSRYRSLRILIVGYIVLGFIMPILPVLLHFIFVVW